MVVPCSPVILLLKPPRSNDFCVKPHWQGNEAFRVVKLLVCVHTRPVPFVVAAGAERPYGGGSPAHYRGVMFLRDRDVPDSNSCGMIAGDTRRPVNMADSNCAAQFVAWMVTSGIEIVVEKNNLQPPGPVRFGTADELQW
jgi:hypothetical protein